MGEFKIIENLNLICMLLNHQNCVCPCTLYDDDDDDDEDDRSK